jgi:hypothetical protein
VLVDGLAHDLEPSSLADLLFWSYSGEAPDGLLTAHSTVDLALTPGTDQALSRVDSKIRDDPVRVTPGGVLDGVQGRRRPRRHGLRIYAEAG